MNKLIGLIGLILLSFSAQAETYSSHASCLRNGEELSVCNKAFPKDAVKESGKVVRVDPKVERVENSKYVEKFPSYTPIINGHVKSILNQAENGWLHSMERSCDGLSDTLKAMYDAPVGSEKRQLQIKLYWMWLDQNKTILNPNEFDRALGICQALYESLLQ